jgi:hypothetical protein
MRLEIGAGTLDWAIRRGREVRYPSALLAGIDPAGEAWFRDDARPEDFERLARDPGGFIVHLDGGDMHPERGLAGLFAQVPPERGEWLAHIISDSDPPIEGARYEGKVRSFLCSPDLFRWARGRMASGARPAFAAAQAAFEGNGSVVGLHVVPWQAEPEPSEPMVLPEPVTWLIPHRGDPAYIDGCLRYVAAEAHADDHIWVCLDEPRSPVHEELVHAHPRVDFWRSTPNGLGPYVARHLLGQRVPTELLIFQDSDDLPMRGRRDTLVAALRASNADLLGSHELRLDEIRGEMVAIRFPVDASDALARTIAHPLYHPTSIIRVEALRRTGGFSTVRRFGGDLHFLLRSFFTMRLRNCGKFRYLRRRHEGSLTTSPDTGLKAPERLELARQWRDDFRRVRDGEIELDASSLAIQHRPDLEGVRLDYLGKGLNPLP